MQVTICMSHFVICKFAVHCLYGRPSSSLCVYCSSLSVCHSSLFVCHSSLFYLLQITICMLQFALTDILQRCSHPFRSSARWADVIVLCAPENSLPVLQPATGRPRAQTRADVEGMPGRVWRRQSPPQAPLDLTTSGSAVPVVFRPDMTFAVDWALKPCLFLLIVVIVVAVSPPPPPPPPPPSHLLSPSFPELILTRKGKNDERVVYKLLYSVCMFSFLLFLFGFTLLVFSSSSLFFFFFFFFFAVLSLN